MDKKKLMETAAEFTGKGDCFIHTEMKNGKNPMTVLSGDVLAMLHGINAELNRIGELTGTGYQETVEALVGMYQLGYSQVKDALKDDPYKRFEGSDFEEEMRKEIKKEVGASAVSLAIENERLKSENTRLNNLIVDLKRHHSSVLKEKDRKIQSLSNECVGLEHQMDDLIERQNRAEGK